MTTRSERTVERVAPLRVHLEVGDYPFEADIEGEVRLEIEDGRDAVIVRTEGRLGADRRYATLAPDAPVVVGGGGRWRRMVLKLELDRGNRFVDYADIRIDPVGEATIEPLPSAEPTADEMRRS